MVTTTRSRTQETGYIDNNAKISMFSSSVHIDISEVKAVVLSSNSKIDEKSNEFPNTCLLFFFSQLRQILEPDDFFFFNEGMNNFRELQLASTCIISCFGSQAPPIPRRTILWGKLKTC